MTVYIILYYCIFDTMRMCHLKTQFVFYGSSFLGYSNQNKWLTNNEAQKNKLRPCCLQQLISIGQTTVLCRIYCNTLRRLWKAVPILTVPNYLFFLSFFCVF
jgi:hypothetical protein